MLLVRQALFRHHDGGQAHENPRREHIQSSSARAPLIGGSVLITQNQQQPAYDVKIHPCRQHGMRRAQDFDIQPVRIMPPVVERRARQHRQRAPDRHPRAQGSPESPDANARSANRFVRGKGRAQDEPAAQEPAETSSEMNADVGRRPKCVAPDRGVPGNIPDNPDDDARRGKDDELTIPRGAEGRFRRRWRERRI